jgi:PAS domain S-box-containing protein
MITPLPNNEAARLAALRALDILDTPSEESFDDLTTLAAYICQAPVALISLIDENRQWFKSKVGVSFCATPRDISFCTHTILQSDLLVVPDALADERVADSPLVTSAPGIRFYAGAPLVTAEGHALGALCVMDYRPRELTAEQLRALRTLSRAVVTLLQCRRQAREAQRAEQALRERLDLTLRGSNIGIWEIDIPDGNFQNSRVEIINVYEQLGYDRPELPTDLTTPLGLVHPDDRERLMGALEAYLEGTSGLERYDFEARTMHKDGSLRWMLSRGVAQRDAAGRPIRVVGSTIDITDVKRAEEALQRANDRLELAFRGSNISIWELDMPDSIVRNGRVEFINLWEQLGYDRPEHPTDLATPLTLVHPDDRARIEGALEAYVADVARELEVEFRVRHKDGSYRWRLSRGVALCDPTGKPIRLIGCSMDITDIKRAEEARRESEQRFRTIVEIANEGIWLIDTEARTRYMNARMAEILGYLPDEVTDLKVSDTWFPEDRAALQELLDRNLRGGVGGQYDIRFRRKDGSAVLLLACTSTVRDSNGQIVGGIGMFTDVTERKRAEEALRESEERYRGTFENAAVGITDVDLQTGHFLRVNQKYGEIVGYTREELLTRTWQEVTYPEDLAASFEKYHPLLRGELPSYSQEKRLTRKDGSTVWIHLTVSLKRDLTGAPVHTIGIVQDISERKRLEQELRQAKEVAEAANRAKDEFLANVSHELRTPFGAILGMTELVLDTPLTEDQRQCLKTVKSAADNLLGILNDLLDISKIEAGKLELDPDDFSLRAALGDTLRALAVRAHRKGLELVCHIQPDVPDALVGDAGRLRQVLLNLVGNAIKFTEEGEVDMRVELAGDSAPAGEVDLRFTVRDTGIGIPAEKQEKVFRAFEQEDTSTTRKYGGTGLGLTIASQLVALMGGTITVDSAPGRGSTFTFTARCGLQTHPAEQVAPPPPQLLRDLPVLVVDDNATNCRILVEWLRGYAMEPTAVADGAMAMNALWQSVELGRSYALVLLDARMPDMDGLALAAMIRQRAALSSCRIILLTSGDRPGDLARYRELHIDGHLLKPVQQDELLETIYRVMRRTNGEAPPRGETVSPAVPAVSPLRVLLAEDNEFNAQHLERLLGMRGHRVQLANNGREALALAEQTIFDLLLLDIQMPELDGFQVIQALREREKSAGGHLPVIALTARSRKEDRQQCLAAGMDDYLSKPIRAADLFAAMERVVSARGVSPTAPKPHAFPRDQPGVGVRGDYLSVLDPVVLLAACGGIAKLLEEMCQNFRSQAPALLAEVTGALRNHDAARLREAAHRLYGTITIFSTVGGQLVSDLEDRAARGPLEEAWPLVEQLEALAQELFQQMDGLSLQTLRRLAEAADKPNRPAPDSVSRKLGNW